MLDRYPGLGGIRIEENVLVTPQGRRILGRWRPRTIEEVEHVRAQYRYRPSRRQPGHVRR